MARTWLENLAATVAVAGVRIATESCPGCGVKLDPEGTSVACPGCGAKLSSATSEAKEKAKGAAKAGFDTFLNRLLK